MLKFTWNDNAHAMLAKHQMQTCEDNLGAESIRLATGHGATIHVDDDGNIMMHVDDGSTRLLGHVTIEHQLPLPAVGGTNGGVSNA